MRRKHWLLSALVLGIVGLIGAQMPGTAAAADHANLAQGFRIDDSKGQIVSGTLVSLKPHTKDVAQLANTTNADTLLGIADSKALVTISQTATEVQVVLNGTTTALVSDINGRVRDGDKITVSPVAGVGMKATKSGQVVGIATSSASGGEHRTITDTHGHKHDILVTRVSLQVTVGHYDVPNNSLLPAFLRSISNTIAGRDVDVIRVLLALIVLVLGFASVITIVFSSVRSSITAIGRNPMAAVSVRLGLLEVMLIALLVAVVTLVISYLVLRV
jgi:hypothetical protein